MSRILRFACVGAAVAGLASVGNAQVCAGTPAFSAGGVRVGGSALFSDQSNAYGGQLALGSRGGFFLDGAYSHAKDHNSDAASNSVTGGVGYEWNVNAANSVQICPMVSVTGQEGSVVGNIPMLNNPQNTLDMNFGGMLGWVASSSSSMQIVPAVGASVVARSYKAKIVNSGQSNPSTTESFGLISGTIGFVVNKVWTISPMVQVPVSQTNGKASYGVGVSYNFSLPHHHKM